MELPNSCIWNYCIPGFYSERGLKENEVIVDNLCTAFEIYGNERTYVVLDFYFTGKIA